MRKLIGLCGAVMLLLTACTAPEVSGGITKGTEASSAPQSPMYMRSRSAHRRTAA